MHFFLVSLIAAKMILILILTVLQSGLRSLHTLQLSSNELSGSFPISSIFTATATATATVTDSNLKILQ